VPGSGRGNPLRLPGSGDAIAPSATPSPDPPANDEHSIINTVTADFWQDDRQQGIRHINPAELPPQGRVHFRVEDRRVIPEVDH
jgi:hypothetical protein